MTSKVERAAGFPAEAGPTDAVVGTALRFPELYDAHFDFVWRSARYLGVVDSALDDAVQDVFVVAHRRLRDFEARSSPRTWLFAITYRVVSDYRRSARRRQRLAQGLAAVTPEPEPTPFDVASRAERKRRLRQVLDALPEQQRVVFALAELEQMSAPEIAVATDSNVNTVYSRLRAARRACALALGVAADPPRGGDDD